MRGKLAVLALLVVLSSLGFGESENHSESKSFQANSSSRPEAPGGQLREKELKFLSELFPQLGRGYFTNLYSKALPEALAKATGKEKEETEVCKIMADVFNRVDKDQLQALVKKVEQERTSEASKETNRDQRYLDLLDRLFWAGNALQGKLSKAPEAQAFLKKFVGENLDFKSGDFVDGREVNRKILAEIDSASKGVEKSKKFLRDNLNKEAALNYAAHNKDAKLADALSATAPGGLKHLDMVGAKGEPVRFFIGKNGGDIQTALAAWLKDKGAFPSLAREPFQNVSAETTFYVKDGKVVQGLPPDLPVPGGAPTPNAPPPPPNREQVGQQQTPPQTPPPPPASGRFDAGQAAAFFKANCSRNSPCHSGSTKGTDVKSFRYVKDGQEYTFAQSLQEVNGTAAMANAVPQPVKDQIKAWADLQR